VEGALRDQHWDAHHLGRKEQIFVGLARLLQQLEGEAVAGRDNRDFVRGELPRQTRDLVDGARGARERIVAGGGEQDRGDESRRGW
jgi:hypothetical protein